MKKKDPITGKFVPTVKVGEAKIWVRVPDSVYSDLFAISHGQIPDFVREAIAEKLERERQQQTA